MINNDVSSLFTSALGIIDEILSAPKHAHFLYRIIILRWLRSFTIIQWKLYKSIEKYTANKQYIIKWFVLIIDNDDNCFHIYHRISEQKKNTIRYNTIIRFYTLYKLTLFYAIRTSSYANQIRIIIPILLYYIHEQLYTIYVVRLNGIRVTILNNK